MNSPSKMPVEIELLLPWYAGGTLDSAESARVEAYLRLHPELNGQLDALREDREASIAANAAISGQTDAALERLMRDIAAETPARLPPARLLDRLDAFLRSLTPEHLSWAAVAATLVILVQTGLLGILLWPGPSDQVTYRTASGGQDERGVQVLIQFNPKVSLGAISRFLADHQAEILSGPKPGGFYQVRLQAGSDRASIDGLGGDKGLVLLVLPLEGSKP
ncbi:MAG: hypothetical protein A2286_00970 [Gammaproteobacteria bacterium RIFOXYA12_FULL_61_12]|nr:MAG: hypothetical protein A2286_00970 [Gammaproteobacteria bacterium RIFOXYA12_FULL_61_12]